MKKITRKMSKDLYYSLLPLYIPEKRSYTKDKLYLAIWCCVDFKDSYNLRKVLKGIRITLRRNGKPVFVIKKGEI
jgi:hypothetical protein